MTAVKLLTVEERFQLSHLGLTVVPDLPVPKGRWSNFEATGSLVTPAGTERIVSLRFTLSHFNISAPEVPKDKRWRVVISLPNLQKDDVPIGSRLFVPKDIRERLAAGCFLEEAADFSF